MSKLFGKMEELIRDIANLEQPADMWITLAKVNIEQFRDIDSNEHVKVAIEQY